MDKMLHHPKVGVGVIVMRDGKVLMHERIGSHGANTWSFPGGHLEFGEAIEDCARREVREETGLEIAKLRIGPYTNDVFAGEGKHYVTLFVLADWVRGEAQVLEPEKCERWEWREWTNMPEPLFLPIRHLRKQGFNPFA